MKNDSWLEKMTRNLVNSHESSWKSKNLHLMGSFCRKQISFRWHWRMMQSFEEKLALGFKNDRKNLLNFNASSDKSEHLYFDVILLSIAYKVSAKKVQKSYLSWQWRVIQTWKKNSLFVSKMTWEIWWILTQAVENLKIGTFMGYFCQKYIIFELK